MKIRQEDQQSSPANPRLLPAKLDDERKRRKKRRSKEGKKKGTKRTRKKVKRKRPGRRKQRNTHTHEKEMGEEERKGRGVGR